MIKKSNSTTLTSSRVSSQALGSGTSTKTSTSKTNTTQKTATTIGVQSITQGSKSNNSLTSVISSTPNSNPFSNQLAQPKSEETPTGQNLNIANIVQSQNTTLTSNLIRDTNSRLGGTFVFTPQRPYDGRESQDDIATAVENASDIADVTGPLGIAHTRPEIIASVDFQPLVVSTAGGVTRTPVGRYVDLQLEARKLKTKGVNDLLKALRDDSQTSTILDEFIKRYNDRMRDLTDSVNVIVKAQQSILDIENGFKLRDIMMSSTKDVVPSYYHSRDSSVESKTIRDLFHDWGFSDQSLQTFSNTRVIQQLIYDIVHATNGIVAQYRRNNFQNRADHRWPFALHTFTITPVIGKLKSTGRTERNAAAETTFNSFNDALSEFSGNSARMLAALTLLSREFRVSAGMSNRNLQSRYLELFGANLSEITDDMFVAMLGEPDRSVFRAPSAIASTQPISSFTYVPDSPQFGQTVLPFEERVLTQRSRQYIPGKRVYIEPIVKNGSVDITAISNYVDRLMRSVDGARDFVDDILRLNDNSTRSSIALKPEGMFGILNDEIVARYPSADSIAVDTRTRGLVIELTLMKLARNDPKLRLLIFKLCVLAGLISNRSNDELQFFSTLVGRLGDIPDYTTFGPDSGLYDPSTSESGRAPVPTWISDERDVSMSSLRAVMREIAEHLFVSTGGGKAQQTKNTQARRAPVDVSDPTAVYEVRRRAIEKSENERTAKQFADPESLALQSNAFNLDLSVETGKTTLGDRFRATPTARDDEAIVFGQLNDVLTAIQEGKSLFNVIANTVHQIDTAARSVAGDRNYIREFTSKTQFNHLSRSTLLFLLFDAFFSYVAMTSTANVTSVQGSPSQFKVQVDLGREKMTLMSAQRSVFGRQSIDTEPIEKLNVTADQGKLTLIGNLKNDIIKEDNMIGLGLHGLSELLSLLRKGKANLASSLGTAESRSRLLAILPRFGPSRTTSIAMLPQQAILALTELEDIKTSMKIGSVGSSEKDASPFWDDTTLSPKVTSFLTKTLSASQFSDPKKKLKILSVGIPAGFTRTLHEIRTSDIRTERVPVSNLTNPKQRDLIQLRVYKRDYEFDAIIFKPKTFAFEISRFCNKTAFDKATGTAGEFIGNNSIESGTNTNFNSIARLGGGSNRTNGTGGSATIAGGNSRQTVSISQGHAGASDPTIDYEINTLESRVQTYADLISDESYAFVRADTREEIVKNHALSYALSLYVKLTTGIALTESSFPLNPASDTDNDPLRADFERLVTTYVRGITGGKVQQIPNIRELLGQSDSTLVQRVENAVAAIQTNVPEMAKETKITLSHDLTQFLRLFSPQSVLGGSTIFSERLLKPKLFERVLNLAIDANDFEIDLNATQSRSDNPVGVQMYQSLKNSNRTGDLNRPQLVETIDSRGVITSARLVKPVRDSIDFVEYFVAIEPIQNRD